MFRKIFYSLFLFSVTFAEKGAHSHSAHLSAEDFSLYWLIPFIGILLSIAVIPLVNASFGIIIMEKFQHFGECYS